MRRLLAVPVLASLLLLAGCVLFPEPGGDRTDDRLDIPAPSCDGPAFLNSPDTHYDLGHCDEVTIEGNGITVDASDVGVLTIRGDDNEVDAAAIGVVVISGNDNRVTGDSVGSVDVQGDRNVVEPE